MTKPENLQWKLGVNFKCFECGKFMSKANQLLEHSIEKHCDGNLYRCLLCMSYSSVMKDHLFQHLRDKHMCYIPQLNCPLCCICVGYTENDIESHIVRDHWAVTPVYCCLLCPFKSNTNIDKHIDKTHNPSKPQNNTSAVKTHNPSKPQNNIPAKLYSCKVYKCSFKTHRSNSLLMHIFKSHFPKLNIDYICEECDCAFNKQMSLQQHNRDKHGIDDDEMSLEIICHLCENYSCENKKTYMKHMKIKHFSHHISYICPFEPCSYQSDKFWEFSCHVEDDHLSEKTYECPVCHTSFVKESGLGQHINSKHLHKLEPICYCMFYFGDAVDHLESYHNLSMCKIVCRLCREEILDGEFENHMKNKHHIQFPEGVEEFYNDN